MSNQRQLCKTATDKSTHSIAKKAIRELFDERDELDYFDIICALDIDLKLVVKICGELDDEGVIGEVLDGGGELSASRFPSDRLGGH